jgi:hypothetical protein
MVFCHNREPLYKPAKNTSLCLAHTLCTAILSSQIPNSRCPSPQQCDYQIMYTDSWGAQLLRPKNIYEILY